MTSPARIQKFIDLGPRLQCPLCASPLEVQRHSARCEHGHSFDIAAKGYLNLLTRPVAAHGYDDAFFESRGRILAAGYYDHVRDAVLAALPPLTAASCVLDAGCGEGFYAKAVCERTDAQVLGIDNARDAIVRAARGGNRGCWLVADLANLPVRDEALDCILNVFTPANYAEFTRAMRSGGTIVKVVPGPEHLSELRHVVSDRLQREKHSNRAVIEHFDRTVGLDARTRAIATIDVRPEQLPDLLRMTPLLFGLSNAERAAIRLDRITIDAEVLVTRKR